MLTAQAMAFITYWFVASATTAAVPESAPGNWTLVKMTEAVAHGAVCLDGSPGAFYIRSPLRPHPHGTNAWVVFMEGGGWCNGDSNCYSRSLGDLGSSKGYPEVVGGMEAQDMFTESFATHTIVYAKYCDGSSWTGNAEAAVKPNASGHPIYYRGARLRDALFANLLEVQGMSKASELVWSGCSAGALTTYIHAEWVKRTVPSTTAVVALADAMFSLEYPDFQRDGRGYYTEQFTWGFSAWNASAALNQDCYKAYGGNESAWMCFHGAIAAQYITSLPVLIVNSKYDTWQQAGVLGLRGICSPTVEVNGTVSLCPQNKSALKFWLGYGQAMIMAVKKLPQMHGAFLTNCPGHCATSGKVYGESAFPGTNLHAAVDQWYPLAIAFAQGSDPSWKAPR